MAAIHRRPFAAALLCLPGSTTIQSDEYPADVAQLVEQLIRNQQVASSSLAVGSKESMVYKMGWS
jgi:hypothetical protein